MGLCCCAFYFWASLRRAALGQKPGRVGPTHLSCPTFHRRLLGPGQRTNRIPESRQELAFLLSRSRRPPPPDSWWWYRACVAWRSFRARGRFACRRRTLALLRRHARGPKQSSDTEEFWLQRRAGAPARGPDSHRAGDGEQLVSVAGHLRLLQSGQQVRARRIPVS